MPDVISKKKIAPIYLGAPKLLTGIFSPSRRWSIFLEHLSKHSEENLGGWPRFDLADGPPLFFLQATTNLGALPYPGFG